LIATPRHVDLRLSQRYRRAKMKQRVIRDGRLDYVDKPLPGLLSAAGIKLDAVAQCVGAAGDSLESNPIADSGIDR